MKVRIGLGVSVEGVRIVAVRDGRVLWGAQAPTETQSIESAAGGLLAAIRPRFLMRPTVIAAVGPARAQLRQLRGLPPLSNRSALAHLVRENSGRFFLRNGVPLVTSGVRQGTNGEAWGAALEQPVVAALEAACRSHRLRLVAVLPTMAVIQHGLRGETLQWSDGDIRAEVECAGRDLRAARRRLVSRNAGSGEESICKAVPALQVLGADGWRYADAYGAAVASPSDSLAHRPARPSGAAQIPKWRLYLAGAACLSAAAAAAASPGLVDQRSSTRATTQLRALSKQRGAAVAAESELLQVSRALDDVAAFDRGRRSMPLFISALTRALPPGSAVVTLRADSAGGVLVALAPRAAVLIGRLESVAELSTPTIVGPVTREAAAGAEVERVTVRFRWNDAPPAPAGSNP